LRLAHACDLLSDPAADHIKMESIATDCGFNNRISFYRCFVAKYDISPNAFRKLARK
jgi:transcriptional regulator GlxA family with amidase domain